MANGKAIVIVGINRGGTSAVAASLNAVGIFTGKHSTPPIYEDRELSTAFRNQNWKKLRGIAEDYASEHDVYAWKLPETRHQLKRIGKLLDNPRFIFVFRDIYAVAMRKQESLNEEAINSMANSIRSYKDITKFAKKRHSEHLFLSYEKILTSPDVFATDLLKFIDLDVSDANIQKITDVISVSPAEYNTWSNTLAQRKSLEEQYGLSGQLHRVDSSVAVGWAKWLKDKTEVNLTLLVDDKEVASFTANQFQGHLVKSQFSRSGNRGFRIKMPLDIETGAEVSVIENKTGAHLVGSPVKFVG